MTSIQGLPPPPPLLSPEYRALLDACVEPAAIIDDAFRLLACNRPYIDRFSDEGRCPCGSHCYEVAHGRRAPCADAGEPCPVLKARTNGGIARCLHVHVTTDGPEHEEVSVRTLPRQDGSGALYLERLRVSPIADAAPQGTRVVGRSGTFTRALELVARVAETDTTVLLLGESGTGKEVLASIVHRLSPRAAKPFVAVNCSGLAESLFESELFGHEAGAFTGAHGTRRGLVEMPRGGTLFLDEIGDIPLSLQVKLLRMIETRRVRRVGANDEQPVDFRLVCATNKHLETMVEAGTFREDLYYRITAFPIHLPPLRERRDDIPLLAASFLQSMGRKVRMSTEALAALTAYSYPGNVRELRNLLERACVLMDGDTLLPDHLPCHLRTTLVGDQRVEFHQLVGFTELERRYLRWALSLPMSRADLARRLGMSERTLFRRLHALRIESDDSVIDVRPTAIDAEPALRD